MKGRFSTLDVLVAVKELNECIVGFRLINVYDIDSKTYLLKLAKTTEDAKAVVLIESGIRIHSTEFEWPKNPAPSSFSMKMRKHLKNKRVEKVVQLGVDRIIDLQFGQNDFAFHVIVELYDRGNLVLTDHEYTIMNLLRQRTDTDQDVKFLVKERYPVEMAKDSEMQCEASYFQDLLNNAKTGDNLRKILMGKFAYGPALLEHSLREAGLHPGAKFGKDFACDEETLQQLVSMVKCSEKFIADLRSCKERAGYVSFKSEKGVIDSEASKDNTSDIEQYLEFHPFCFSQMKEKQYHAFQSFNKCVDDFFSKVESQKLEMKRIQQEKAALKKLDNIRKDHDKRVNDLQSSQEHDCRKAEVIIANSDLVDRAIANVNFALANQIDWNDIDTLIKEARQNGDEVANSIVKLKLDSNKISLELEDYNADESSDEEDTGRKLIVDVDLSVAAYANAKKYYDQKRSASKKEMKTLSSSKKALKSAEEKTKQMLKDAQTVSSINKVRKIHWFEKFFWFISSENYLVVAGRDQQQNEMLVKRYLRAGDVYVHADLHGASSVIVKNPKGGPVAPKTLNEAGCSAVVYSSAWTAKVVVGAWWVNAEQVSKTPPSGEYLTPGSFMIRGKKNYLPPCQLAFGFGFLFRVDEESLPNHVNERRVRAIEEVIETEDSVNEEEVEELVAIDEDEEGDEEDEEGDVQKEGENATSAVKIPEEENELEEEDGDGMKKEDDDNLGEEDEDGKKEVEGGDDSETSDEAENLTDKEKEEHESYGEDIKAESIEERDITGGSQGQIQTESGIEISQGIKEDFDEDDTSEKEDLKERMEKLNVDDKSSGVEEIEFPDTELTIDYAHAGGKLRMTSLSEDVVDDAVEGRSDQPRTNRRLSARERRDLKKQRRQKMNPDSQSPQPPVQSSKKQTEPNKPKEQPPKPEPQKRGQKNKIKKARAKYGDQDEEEREMRMKLLHGGEERSRQGKKYKKKMEEERKRQEAEEKRKRQEQKMLEQQKKQQQRRQQLRAGIEVDDEQEDDDAERFTTSLDDGDILNSLTGIPLEDDILLYAVPVCAPYQAMLNYKFKAKLIPGTAKRGKATKAALQIFMNDRSTLPREKDLLRVQKDQDLSRNFPGKVKLSVPHLNKQRR